MGVVLGCLGLLVSACGTASGSALSAAEPSSSVGSAVSSSVASVEEAVWSVGRQGVPGDEGGATGLERAAEGTRLDASGLVSGFVRVQDSPSLDAVAGLSPTEWPWFADGTVVPADATAGAAVLLSVLSEGPLAGWRVLAAEEWVAVGDDIGGRRFQAVMLKDPAGGVLKVHAQPLAPDDWQAPEGGPYEYRQLGEGSWAELDEGDDDSYVLLVRGGRMLVLWCIALAPAQEPYFSAEQLLAVALEIDNGLAG